MNAGQLAALIAAGFFAVGMCAVVFVLLRLAGLISHANRIMTDYGDRAATLIERAQAAVDRTNEQLERTDSITASMDEVTANMADLSGHVAALAGLARGISAGFGTPLLRASAFVFGVRRAVWLRRRPGPPPASPSPFTAAAALPEPRAEALPVGGSVVPRGEPVRQRGALPRQRGLGAGRRQAQREARR
jgi:Bacterial protein of unknown function (DUF948)